MRDRTARQAKVAGQVELILSEVDQLEREQKWPEALVAARRAEAVVAGGEADAATARRVRERLKDLEFIDRLEQIRMQQAAWAGARRSTTPERTGSMPRPSATMGWTSMQLAVETSIERLKARPHSRIPLAAALDDWVSAPIGRRSDAADWKRLVAVARGIDPEPLRDRLRATWGSPTSEVRDELLRLAESIDVRAHHPATLVNLATGLRASECSRTLPLGFCETRKLLPGRFLAQFRPGRSTGGRTDYEGAVRFYTAAVAIRPHAVAALNNLLAHGEEAGRAVAYRSRRDRTRDEANARPFVTKADEAAATERSNDPTFAALQQPRPSP